MRLRSLVGIVVLALAAACGGGDEQSVLGSLWVQTDIAGADIDGDGRADVVTVAMLQQRFGVSDGYLKIYRQLTPGAFSAQQIVIGRYPWRVAVADIDGDGAPDLLVLDVIGGSGVNDDVLYLLLQDPNNRGRFLAPRVIASGLSTYDFTVTDVNDDGVPDIVIAGGADGRNGVQWLVQNRLRRGTFQAPTTFVMPGRAANLTAADLDGDGRADLVTYSVLDFSVAANSPGLIVAAYALPGGGYGTPFTLAPQLGLNAQIVRVADVDGNGLPDILVAFTAISTSFRAKLTVLLQTVNGRFTAVDTTLANLSGLDGFVVADLNGDNRPDVATTGFFPVGSPTTVRSHTNLLVPIDAGAYGVAAVLDMPVPMDRINAVDINGDGLNDLILLGDTNRAFVMLQSAASPGTFAAPRQL